VTNPVEAQNSPAIRVRSEGIPIADTLMTKETGYPGGTPTPEGDPCGGEAVCDHYLLDGAPLKVIAPMFLQRDIVQTTPYPHAPNIMTVTLRANIPLTVGTLITLSNLDGGIAADSIITLTGTNADRFNNSIGISGSTSSGSWDQDAKKLTLIVATEIAAGVASVFNFQLTNPSCEQPSPVVCLRASRIETACLDCAAGNCVSIDRQMMDRDVSEPTSGSAYPNAPNFFWSGEHYSHDATVTYGSTQSGDLFPLRVYPSAFIPIPYGDIYQSSFDPSDVNNITITFATTVPLRTAVAGVTEGTKVTFTGLTGSATPSGILTLTSVVTNASFPAVFSDSFNTSGVWTQDGNLTLTVTADTIAGVQYAFRFSIENPSCSYDPVLVTMSASPLCFAPMEMLPPADTDLHPISVKPLEINSSAWQSTPYPGTLNTISVQFSTTVDMVASTKITIMGLTGTDTTNTTVAVDLVAVGGGPDLAATKGDWNQTTGTLVVTLDSPTLANTEYTITVDLLNPLCCQEAKSLKIHADLGCVAVTDVTPVTDVNKLEGLVADDDTADSDESAPLFVRCPRWVAHTKSQSTDHPCATNTLNVTLQLNVPMEADVVITLAGIQGTQTMDSNITLSASSGLTSPASWTQSDGTLLVVVASRRGPFERISLEFDVVNPVSSLLVVNTVDLSADVCALLPVTDFDASSRVVEVTDAVFTAKEIGQSTFWPGSLNTITLTLASNVPLSCDVVITIAGFDGASCVNATNGYVALAGAGAAKFNNSQALWSEGDYSMELTVVSDLGDNSPANTVVSFNLVNPVEAQPSPRLTISASGIQIDLSDMVKDSVNKLNDTVYDEAALSVASSAVGVVFNAAERDAEPLRSEAPAFIVRNVGQSSHYPGADNTIGVTLRPNVDLSVGSVVTISVFNSIDGTTAWPSGPIDLADLQVASSDGTVNSTWFTANRDSVNKSKGLWDDDARTLTLYVDRFIGAGMRFGFTFNISNPLCAQDEQPVCVRARNLVVNCHEGIVIPRRRMDHDTDADGVRRPLYIIKSDITTAAMAHSSPWPSDKNSITITFQSNVPVRINDPRFSGAELPYVTIAGLTGTETASVAALGNITMGGVDVDAGMTTWDQGAGVLTFKLPAALKEDTNYTIALMVENKDCQQDAPNVTMNMSGLCFDTVPVDKTPLAACGVDSEPLEVRGGACSAGASSSALFTVGRIAQSTPYPGCLNTITVTFQANVPVLIGETITLDFADTLVMGHAPGAMGSLTISNGAAAAGTWDNVTNVATLVLSTKLTECTEYSVTFQVLNPMVEQASQAVSISVSDGARVIIPASTLEVGTTPLLTLPGTNNTMWLGPMETQPLNFIVKGVRQSSPYPGLRNTLTVSFLANTDLKVGTVLAFAGFQGASRENGDIPLSLPYAADEDQAHFESMAGTLGNGTWNDCEKALTMRTVSNLGCAGTIYTVSFEVRNPLEPQLCVDVRINATQIPVDPLVQLPTMAAITEDNAVPANSVWAGQVMTNDMSNKPEHLHVTSANVEYPIYSAMNQDACPMKVWPGAFIIKNIGQSSEYPCAINEITVTLTSNIPIPASVKYWDLPEPIKPRIIISRLLNAGNNGSSINVTARNYTVNPTAGTTTSFDATGVWSTSPAVGGGFEGEVSVSADIFGADNNDCCLPKGGMVQPNLTIATEARYILKFTITNPASGQDPTRAISIAATGVPITASGMIMAQGTTRPMFITTPRIMTKEVWQSSPYPCDLNEIRIKVRLNVPLYTRCIPSINVTGLEGWEQAGDIALSTNVLNMTTSPAMWDGATRSLQTEVAIYVEINTDIEFGFTIINGKTAVEGMMPSIEVTGLNMHHEVMTLKSGEEYIPVTILEPRFDTLAIVQQNPYPAASNVLTVTLTPNVNLPSTAACGVTITISGLDNACHSDGNIVITDTDQIYGQNGLQGKWDADRFQLTLELSHGGMLANTSYDFTFEIRNPSSGQRSPMVMVEASGLTIQRRAMDKNPLNVRLPAGVVFDPSIEETEPLEVRGELRASAFEVKNIGQSSAYPGATNTITVTFASSVPLTKEAPVSTVSISGLAGVVGRPTNFNTTGPSGWAGSFDFEWVSGDKAVVLTVMDQDTLAGSNEYVVRFDVTNPLAGQMSPSVMIEASGIVIQPTLLMPDMETRLQMRDDNNQEVEAMTGSAAPMYVFAPRIVKRLTYQTFNGAIKNTAAYPGDDNQVFFKFTCTAAIDAPGAGDMTALVISGLQGVVLDGGSVNIGGTSQAKFTDCEELSAFCTGSKGVWDEVRKSLTLYVKTKIAADEEVVVSLNFKNELHGQDPPRISISLSSNSPDQTFDIAPVAFMHDPSKNADETSLLIKHTATFTTKNIWGSTDAPGAVSTVTVELRPEYDLTGNKYGKITISGLVGSSTMDGMVKLLPFDTTQASVEAIKKFNSQASWNRRTGTLVLSVAPDETVSKDADITFKFDLLNPKYGQDGPDLETVLVSASGDVPLAGTCMAFPGGGGQKEVLKVGTADFSAATIEGSSTAPGTKTELTVSFTPGVLLNEVRESYIMVSGLSGTRTLNSDAIPLVFSANPTSVNDFRFVAPKGHNVVGFTEECKLANDKMMLKSPLRADLTDAWIIFDKDGHCATNGVPAYAKVSADDDGCLTIGTWSTPSCKDKAGEISEVRVTEGGYGFYKPTATGYQNMVTVVEGTGTGFVGECIVDKYGSVTSINITNRGTGYGPGTALECESSCDANACAHAEDSRPAALEAVVLETAFSIVGGEWHQASGTIKMHVRGQMPASASYGFKFELMNALVERPAVDATILAGGAAPIRSKELTGDTSLMKVTKLSTAVTAVCSAIVGTCTADFASGITANLVSYTIKAERQCNGKASNLRVNLILNSSTTVPVPAENLMATDDDECVDACSKYQPLFSYIDVKALVPAYKAGADLLQVEILADGLNDVDHCGSGDNIKAIVTMEYDEDNEDAP